MRADAGRGRFCVGNRAPIAERSAARHQMCRRTLLTQGPRRAHPTAALRWRPMSLAAGVNQIYHWPR
jgi:hypothetical protein